MRCRASRLAWCSAALLAAVCGCALLDEGSETALSKATKLPSIPKPRDAISVAIVRARRPIGDADLGSDLWNELQEVGASDVSTRKRLRESGFRVGHAASRPPSALAHLLGLSSSSSSTDRSPVSTSELAISAGEEFYVPASAPVPEQTIDLDGDGAGEPRTLRNVNFKFKVVARKLQDGWASLDFVPEIHHGDEAWRATPTAQRGEAGFSGRTQQEVIPLYDQRFEVKLNQGEFVVVTADTSMTDGLAAKFFRGVGLTAGQQEVVVIRLQGLSEVKPVLAR